ncbi:hypothetical protein OHV05_14880 [Kitasatospora sp. NBC_00070]|uniref:hypothetical protein n=1 Tax=Kitasatospora sp. NBC_00070 TaxID=2975962 RepID=UPI00324D8EE6
MPRTATITLPGRLVAALDDRDAFQSGPTGSAEDALADALFANATRIKRGSGVSVTATLTAEQIGALADHLHSLLGLVDCGIAPASEFGVSRARLADIVQQLSETQDATEAEDARRDGPESLDSRPATREQLAALPDQPQEPIRNKYLVAVDEIRVHLVPVLARTHGAAELEAARIVQADRKTWFDRTRAPRGR